MICYLTLLETEDEKAAFLALYEANKGYLWAMTGRFFSDSDRRGDAFQDAWASAAKNFPKIFALPCEFQTPYLIVIVKNACRAILNKEKRFVPLPEAPEETDALLGSVCDPDPAGVAGDAGRALELLSGLPENYRAVLEARLVLGLQNSEVAKQLGITPAKASTWFDRGKALLAKRLMEEGICYE